MEIKKHENCVVWFFVYPLFEKSTDEGILSANVGEDIFCSKYDNASGSHFIELPMNEDVVFNSGPLGIRSLKTKTPMKRMVSLQDIAK